MCVKRNSIASLVFTIFIYAFLVQPAGAEQRITCYSNNNSYNYCRVYTGNQVRLTRQHSNSSCIQGQSWGFDSNGIWVDRGCRAEFAVGGGRYNMPGPGYGQRITCNSNNNGYNYCRIYTGNQVRLVKRHSHKSCTQGQSWGFDSNGIWVDRGCRAEFEVGGGGHMMPGPGPEYGSPHRPEHGHGYGQRVTCNSNNNGYNYCRIYTGNQVRLVKRHSHKSCTQGQSWGFDSNGIWVDRGCRAEFEVGGGGHMMPGPGSEYGYPHRPGPGRGQRITCNSNNNAYNYCRIYTGNRARLTRQHSNSSCIKGQSWGFDSNGIWVDRGCRAEFEVGF